MLFRRNIFVGTKKITASMKQSSNTILTTKTKYPYIRPCTEVILLDLSGALNETHVSGVNIKGFDKGEVPGITVVEDDDGDDDEPANAKHSVWDDDEPDTWL